MVKRPLTSDDVEPIQSAIGHFMMTWNLAESLLDTMVAIAYHTAGGNDIEREIPFKLDRKLKFAGRAFRRLEPLKPFRARGEKMVDLLRAARSTRDTLAHGHITEVTDEGGVLHFGKFSLSKDRKMQVHQIADLSVSKILLDAGECHRVTPEMIALCHEMIEALVTDDNVKKLPG